MPTKNVYVKPQVFMRYKGVTVYHTYECGEFDEQNTYHFCTVPEDADSDDSGVQFDVRELGLWVAPVHPPFLTGKDDTPENKKAWRKYHENNVELKAIKKAIRDTINFGGEDALYERD